MEQKRTYIWGYSVDDMGIFIMGNLQNFKNIIGIIRDI